MALPAGITTCTVTLGPLTDIVGGGCTVDATLTPVYGSAKSIVWAATNQTIMGFALREHAEPGAEISFTDVPHVDQAGFVDELGNALTGWAYRLDATVTSSSGAKSTITRWVNPTGGQPIFDADSAPGTIAATPTSIPLAPVLTVNGQTGNVVVEAGGLDETALAAWVDDSIASGAIGDELATRDTAISEKAADSAVVHKTGAETIAGVKTFESGVEVPDDSLPISAVASLATTLGNKASTTALTDLANTVAGKRTITDEREVFWEWDPVAGDWPAEPSCGPDQVLVASALFWADATVPTPTHPRAVLELHPDSPWWLPL